MLTPLSWLCDFAPFSGDPASIAVALDELGLVVEEVRRVGEGLGDVVLARVLEIGPIRGADRIRRVRVDAGGSDVEVVCGAWNFAEGDTVALAPVGAVLPGDFEITRRTMKGVTSNGMLCSGRELALSDEHEGILVLAEGSAQPGTALVDALGIEPDVVYDIAVEANRPDAWCMAGVARDLAAALRLPFSIPEPRAALSEVPPPVGELTTVEVIDPDLCPRFTARVLVDVVVAPSPTWVQRRLTLAGMRPINNVVDASNYAMLDLGQPTHPYDLDALAGGGLRVRAARRDEPVTTLDGVERRTSSRSLGMGDDQRDCLICDAEDDPVGIGGVMGGASSEISPATRRVLLEAAYFTPMAIARTSKRLQLRSEASARFERGCDPEGIDRAARRFVEVLALSAGAEARLTSGVIDVRGEVPGPARVTVRASRVNAVLGTELSVADVAGYLTPIGFDCAVASDDVLDVTVPTFRPDTAREIDVVEEVARHHGYGNVPRRRPFTTQVGRLSPYQRERRLVRAAAAGLGAHEAWTPSLLGPDDHARAGMAEGVAVANPLSPDESVLRRSILPGMLAALAFNADRRQGQLRLFEFGHVFPPPDAARVTRVLRERGDTVIAEREMLALLLADEGDDGRTAAEAWSVIADDLGVIDVALRAPDAGVAGPPGLHPARAAWLVSGADGSPSSDGAPDGAIGVVGEVDPETLARFGIDGTRRRVGWLEVDLGQLLGAVPRRPSRLASVSRFPSSDIDLAFVVDDAIPAASVQGTLARAGGALLDSLALFDVYRGEGVAPGTRSLAYRLRFCAPDRTLTDAEVAEVRTRCIAAVADAHGAALRA